MISLDQLLSAISSQAECGDDISYDPAFLELDTLLLGKPETQFSAAEPPNWKLIAKTSEDLLGRSKHLRLVIALTAALLRTEGFDGFRDGLTLLQGLIERYWDGLYPRLDPEDGNDPTERINIISALAAPLGTTGDPYGFINALRAAPLTQSVQLGRFSFSDILAAQTAQADSTSGPPGPTTALVDAAFQDTPQEVLVARRDALATSTALVQSIQQLLGDKVGLAEASMFDPLVGAIKEILRAVAAKLPEEAMPVSETAVLEAGGDNTPSPQRESRRGISGAVESRDDVVRALDAVCAYYQRYEPSSPVPLLLDRAKRLVNMNFLALVEDLNPEALAEIYRIAGIK